MTRTTIVEQRVPAQPVAWEPPPPDAGDAADLIRLEPPEVTFEGAER